MITAVLTSYNYGFLLHRSIEAILKQTLQPSEFIIIDDNSTDESYDIIRKYTKYHSRIKVIKNDFNQGVISSIKHGLKIATNPYILFCSADDIIYPELIEQSLSLLEKYPQAGFSMASAAIINEKGNQTGLWKDCSGFKKKEFFTREDSMKRMYRCGFWFVGATTVFNRELLIKAGGFKPELGHYCDSFISQILALRHGFCCISKPLASIRIVQSSYSQKIRHNLKMEYELQNRVLCIMKSEYNDIFPSDFINSWYKINRLVLGINAWKNEIYKCQMLFIEQKIPIIKPKINRLDRLFRLSLKLLCSAQFFFYILYLTAYYGRNELFMQYVSLRRFKTWISRL